eukprot:COSAG01_NODE_5666_length_4112_cov_2.211562_1_plen_456_part_00
MPAAFASLSLRVGSGLAGGEKWKTTAEFGVVMDEGAGSLNATDFWLGYEAAETLPTPSRDRDVVGPAGIGSRSPNLLTDGSTRTPPYGPVPWEIMAYGQSLQQHTVDLGAAVPVCGVRLHQTDVKWASHWSVHAWYAPDGSGAWSGGGGAAGVGAGVGAGRGRGRLADGAASCAAGRVRHRHRSDRHRRRRLRPGLRPCHGTGRLELALRQRRLREGGGERGREPAAVPVHGGALPAAGPRAGGGLLLPAAGVAAAGAGAAERRELRPPAAAGGGAASTEGAAPPAEGAASAPRCTGGGGGGGSKPGGWSGARCAEPLCLPACVAGQGVCARAHHCRCEAGYHGEACAEERCGDGHASAGEECDDGNPRSRDGCDPACLLEDPRLDPSLNESLYVQYKRLYPDLPPPPPPPKGPAGFEELGGAHQTGGVLSWTLAMLSATHVLACCVCGSRDIRE